jgi:hypothetical protein
LARRPGQRAIVRHAKRVVEEIELLLRRWDNAAFAGFGLRPFFDRLGQA